MNTKKITFLVITLFLFSCTKQNEVIKLEKKINKLKMENLILLDSIKKIKLNTLQSLVMQINPKETYLKMNETNKLSFSFLTFSELPKYKLDLIETKNGIMNETTIYEGFTKPKFEYDYKPKNKFDKIEFIAYFFAGDKMIVIPHRIELPYRN